MGCVHKRGEKIGCLGKACVPCMFSSCCSCCCSVSQLKFLIWNWHAIKLAVCQSVWDVEPVEIGASHCQANCYTFEMLLVCNCHL
jgi:hypothetical protein